MIRLRGLVAFGIACELLCVLGMPASAVTPAQYDHALAEVQQALEHQAHLLQGAPKAAPDTVPLLALARRDLLPVVSVQTRDGESEPVSSMALLQTLSRVATLRPSRARGNAYRQSAAQIGYLRTELAASRDAGDAQKSLTAARAVLATADFASDPLPSPSLLDRFLAWLDRILSRRSAARVPSPQINPQFVTALLIILAVGAFALLVAVLVPYLRRRPRATAPLAMDETEAALVEARDADSLRALAEEQARREEWRQAFRLLYLASLVALDTGGVLRFDRSKTNWEYLRALRAGGRGDVFQVMTPFTREFDRVWYGVARAGAGDYYYAVQEFEAMRAFARVGSPAPASA